MCVWSEATRSTTFYCTDQHFGSNITHYLGYRITKLFCNMSSLDLWIWRI